MVGEGDAAMRNLILQPLTPVADFNAARMNICASEVRFSDRSGSASQWLWDFGDGNTSTEKNPLHSYEQEGSYSVKLIASNCAGTDTILKQISIIRPAAPIVTGDTSFCGAVVHRLQALSPNPVLWYSSASSVLPLDSSQVFFTPVLDSTMVYYVRSSKPLELPDAGPADNQFGGGSYFTGNTYHYLSFDAQSAFRLKSVRVYANTAGNRSIQLRNALGQVIRTKTVQIPQGDSRVELGFEVPQGDGFQLGLAGGVSNNLFRNNSGASYPYKVDGILSINGNSAGNPGFYYYYYDWEISASCQSAAVPVTAMVEAPRPQVSIASISDSICEESEILLQANFTQAADPQLSWFDGNLPLGTGNNLQVSLSGAGLHTITCRLFSADTCAVNNPATSLPKQVVVLPSPPAPVIVQNGNWLVSGSGPVSWFLSGQTIGAGPSDSIFISASGSYSAIAFGLNGCASPSSQPLDVTSFSGRQSQLFRMYANGDELLVENRSGNMQELEVFDAAGRCLRNLKAASGSSSFNLAEFPAGLLLVRSRESGMLLKLVR